MCTLVVLHSFVGFSEDTRGKDSVGGWRGVSIDNETEVPLEGTKRNKKMVDSYVRIYDLN